MQHTSDEDLLSQAVLRRHGAIERFVECARRVPDAEWLTPRAAGKWPPAQEAMHLVLTYRAYTAEARNGPSVTPETFVARNPKLRTEVLPRILAGDWFPSGAVSPAVAQPDDAPREKEDVLHDLIKYGREFASAVVEAAAKDPARFVRHPYFGALSLHELVIVLAEHAHHHRKHLPERNY